MRLCTHEMGSFRCPNYHSSVMMMMMIGSSMQSSTGAEPFPALTPT